MRKQEKTPIFIANLSFVGYIEKKNPKDMPSESRSFSPLPRFLSQAHPIDQAHASCAIAGSVFMLYALTITNEGNAITDGS